MDTNAWPPHFSYKVWPELFTFTKTCWPLSLWPLSFPFCFPFSCFSFPYPPVFLIHRVFPNAIIFSFALFILISGIPCQTFVAPFLHPQDNPKGSKTEDPVSHGSHQSNPFHETQGKQFTINIYVFSDYSWPVLNSSDERKWAWAGSSRDGQEMSYVVSVLSSADLSQPCLVLSPALPPGVWDSHFLMPFSTSSGTPRSPPSSQFLHALQGAGHLVALWQALETGGELGNTFAPQSLL